MSGGCCKETEQGASASVAVVVGVSGVEVPSVTALLFLVLRSTIAPVVGSVMVILVLGWLGLGAMVGRGCYACAV